MENLLKTSLIKGLVFGIYGEMGPQPLYCFPNSMKQEDIEKLTKKDLKKGILHLTHRDYTQIAIKNLSLLIGDGTILNRVDIQNFQYFGIVPFPDFRLTSLTYFHFVKTNLSEIPLASSFSILVEENRRSFLYNNIERLKAEILAFFKRFDIKLVDEYPVQEEVQPFFERFLQKIILIERSPSTPFTTHRKMKILLLGLMIREKLHSFYR